MSHAYAIIRNANHIDRPVDKLNHFSPIKQFFNWLAAPLIETTVGALQSTAGTYGQVATGGKDLTYEELQQKGFDSTMSGITKANQQMDGVLLAGSVLASAAGLPFTSLSDSKRNITATAPEPTLEQTLEANALPIAGGVGVVLLLILILILR